MTAISRRQFDNALANHAIDVQDPGLETAVAGSGLDLAKLDRLDGAVDDRISGQQALEQLYADLDALDKKTAGLGSEKSGPSTRRSRAPPSPLSPSPPSREKRWPGRRAKS